MSETHQPASLIGDCVASDTLESQAVISKQRGTPQTPKPDISQQREEGPVPLRNVSLAAFSSRARSGRSNPSSFRCVPVISVPLCLRQDARLSRGVTNVPLPCFHCKMCVLLFKFPAWHCCLYCPVALTLKGED